MSSQVDAESSSPRPWRAFSWGVVALFFATLPALIYCALHVRSDNADVTQWLPAGDAERSQYEWFVKHFGIDDYVIVSWDGCTPEDERLRKFADAVRSRLGDQREGGALVSSVQTTAEVLDRLTSPPLRLPAEEAEERLAGAMLGAKTRRAAAFVKATLLGKKLNAELVDMLYDIAKNDLHLEQRQLYLGGSLFEAVTIDRESLASLRRFVVPSGIAVLLLALISVRNVRLALIMLVVSVYSQLLATAVVYLSDASLDAALMIMPTLIYICTMSGSLYLVNYFQHAVALGRPDPAGWALSKGWRPCVGSSLTTAVGLGSLMMSEVKPVKLFGQYSGLNVLLGLGVLLLFTPCALRLFGGRPALSGRVWQMFSERSALSFAGWITRRHVLIIVAVLAGLVATAPGLNRLRTSLNLQLMFPEDSPLVRNYTWLEQEVGPLIAVEVVLAFRQDAEIRMLDQIRTIQALEEQVRKTEDIASTLSAMTFVPEIPAGGSFGSVAGRMLFIRRLEARKEGFIEDDVLADDGASDLWRITAHMSALEGIEYGEVTDEIRQRVEAKLAELPQNIQDAITVYYTGLTPIVYQAQQQMLTDLKNSFLTAFVLIAGLMMILQKSILAGLLTVLPNVTPILMIFGILGLADVPIDIGIILTASVGLGIAVDAALHFAGWYRGCLSQGMAPTEALASSLKTCGPAMAQTTVICSLGLMVFALSDFIPTARFAWVMMWLLMTALCSNLVFLPALITSRLGRVFRVKPDAAPEAGEPL